MDGGAFAFALACVEAKKLAGLTLPCVDSIAAVIVMGATGTGRVRACVLVEAAAAAAAAAPVAAFEAEAEGEEGVERV